MTKRVKYCQSKLDGAAKFAGDSTQKEHPFCIFVEKIGEGTYGDVELWKGPKGNKVAIKRFKPSDNIYRVS